MSKISVKEFNEIIKTGLPWADEAGMVLESIEAGKALLKLPFKANSLRPGGTIAGPHMMALSDACMYAVVLSLLGEAKLAVTTSFNVNFLRKPGETDLFAEGRIIKLGKRLAISEVSVFSDGNIVSHATGTYSIPPQT